MDWRLRLKNPNRDRTRKRKKKSIRRHLVLLLQRINRDILISLAAIDRAIGIIIIGKITIRDTISRDGIMGVIIDHSNSLRVMDMVVIDGLNVDRLQYAFIFSLSFYFINV